MSTPGSVLLPRRRGCHSWWRIALGAILFVSNVSISVQGDNLGTLRTYQRSGCDDHVVSLHCPPGTSISVQQAQYGRSVPHHALCQPGRQSPQDAINQIIPDNNTCLWPDTLQTVVETCQKKRQCQFQTSPRTLGSDPCPGVRKWVEVSYKCRPYEFRSKVACENDVVQLQCNPNSRIAVYSASYGRTEYESIQCPQPQRVPEETCLMSYATETVMNHCHGKRSCTIYANKETFGSPCRPESRMYLKVVYTCVPRRVLKEEYEGPPEADETRDDSDAEYELGFDDNGSAGLSPFSPAPKLHGEPPAGNRSAPVLLSPGNRNNPNTKTVGMSGYFVSPRPRNGPSNNPTVPSGSSSASGSYRSSRTEPVVHQTQSGEIDDSDTPLINCTVTIYSAEKTRVIGIISEWINTYTFMKKNQEKLYLYLTLSVAAGLVLFLVLIIGRLLVQRHRARSEAKFRAANAAPDRAIPNGFADDISEIDADIDLTTPVAVPVVAVHSPPVHEPAEVVRYGGTLRRGGAPADIDVREPRSLNRGAGINQQYYYG